MTIEGQISKPLSAGSMLAITGGAFVAGSLIVFGAILPAEFNWDPLGFGRTTGLNRLWAPREVTFDTTTGSVPLAREYPMGFRTDVIEILCGREAIPRAAMSSSTKSGCARTPRSLRMERA